MKKKSVIALGPGAPSLILIFVVLSMSVLAMLALMNAKNDLNMSRRSAEVAEIVAQLNERAEQRHRDLDRLLAACVEEAGDEDEARDLLATRLPDDVRLEDHTLLWSEVMDERQLDCALTLVDGEGGLHTEWSRHRLITQLGDGETEDLWD